MITPAAGATVVDGPIINPANGHGYYKLERADWSAAEQQSVALGGHLVTVNNAEEQAWLEATFGPITSNFDDNSFWIGYYSPVGYTGNLNDYIWSSGETPGFVNWNFIEPNPDGGSGIDLAYIGRYADGTWNNVSDTYNSTGAPPFFGVTEVTNLLPGDANVDGVVDLADFAALRSSFGLAEGAAVPQGDFNGDRAVNLADFGILRSNFGAAAGLHLLDAWHATVPEPRFCWFAVAMIGFGCTRRARR